jgi:penicillin-binding protein 1C
MNAFARMRRWKRLLFVIVFCATFTALAIIGFIASVRIPEALRNPGPVGTLVLLDARGGTLAEIGNVEARSQRPLSLAEMGRHLPGVTIALEDRRYREHHGVDWHALGSAAWNNLRHGRIVSGASTITGQLVKMASGRTRRGGWLTKARETVAAWKLERIRSKDEILARYLNTISYGNRLLGPEAAARVYFDKPAADLTLAESIYLAGLPQAPSRFNPWRHQEAAERKYRRDLARLRALGVISEDEWRRLAENLPAPGRHLPDRRAPHFVDAVLKQTPVRSGIIRTTLDPEMQQTAERLLREHLRSLRRQDFAQAALVVIENSSGAVRALVGSSDYQGPRGQNNAALLGRSAGSALKPFLYLNAIDRRLLTAASLLPDTAEAVREVYADYDPQNYSRLHVGPVRVRNALGNSLNVPAVVALGRVGARQMFFELGRWGLRMPQSFDAYGAGFILGNVDVRLLDLTGAYAGIARGGIALTPRLLSAGPAPQAERVSSPEAAAIVADMLCDPDARRITFRPDAPINCPVRVAVKTGTSSGFRDGWCVGFTGRHTVGVWAGNFDNRPMDELLAVRSAAPLWRATIDYLLEQRHDPPVPLPAESERLARRDICPLTGLRPSPGSPPAIKEYFLAGTEPTADAATMFVGGNRDIRGSHRLRLPIEYAGWTRSAQNVLGAVTEDNQPLAIVSPPDGADYLFDTEIAASQQMLELTTNAPEPQQVRWRVNGQTLSPQVDGRYLWPLTRGRWEVTAAVSINAGGEERRASSSIQVE